MLLASLLPSALNVPELSALHRHCDRSKSMPGGSKIDPRRLQNRSSEGPKSSQDRPDGGQERPRAAQECRRASQERHRSVARAPQERPRAPQELPRAPQERPKSAQERPKSRSRAPQDAPDSPLRTILRARNCEKVIFEGDPSCDSVEKCVRNDFRSIFASCAQERIHEKPVKTIGFYRFFACRLIFQRCDSPDQKTTEKSLKSSPRRAKIDLGSIKIAPRSPFRASSDDQVGR